MDSGTIATTIVGGLVTLGAAWIGLRGIRDTIKSSRAANDTTLEEARDARVMQAWKDLLEPLQSEVGRLHERVEEQDEKLRRQADTLEQQSNTIHNLGSELHRWQSMARTLARWGLRLRDQVISLGGTVPADPEELILMRVIEDADASRKS